MCLEILRTHRRPTCGMWSPLLCLSARCQATSLGTRLLCVLQLPECNDCSPKYPFEIPGAVMKCQLCGNPHQTGICCLGFPGCEDMLCRAAEAPGGRACGPDSWGWHHAWLPHVPSEESKASRNAGSCFQITEKALPKGHTL